ncbi:MAG TPA: SulP family inorganic anion transporter [Burkholderiales bacterium]|nr:SulP family inorganic anion transporter [Burkholderiales bacterium]
MKAAQRLFPFLSWFPISSVDARADVVAGLTVAMVLIPQSMAYAQLAGLPPHYGLYAAFFPVVIGALWGSSRQLSTGPVAMVSLLTGSTLASFAPVGSEAFVGLAVVLALMVGTMQLVMGAFRLGAIVSFVSHPAIAGFTNAAAIIIALSQLNKLLGVPMPRTDFFLQDVWDVFQQAGDAHLPTLVMGLAALAIMIAIRRWVPLVPGVLVAVAITTVASWALGYERRETAAPGQFPEPLVQNLIENVTVLSRRVDELNAELMQKTLDRQRLVDLPDAAQPRLLALNYDIEVLRVDLRMVEREHRLRARELRQFSFDRVPADGGARFHLRGVAPAHTVSDGRTWRVASASRGTLHMTGGGDVVGSVPSGLPAFALPRVDWDTLVMLVSTAFVIMLVAFMEAISIAKAMATRTQQRIDANQELIGQGLANIVGSFTQSFPVSGSFSRSAVNLASGAVTGMASVVCGAIVLATLLFFTPLLYHLPQATLAAVIVMAVVNLVNVRAMLHAWQAQRHDGITAVVTFVATLAFAPHLDTGILTGAALAIVLYLYRTMHPRVAVLGRHADGTLRDALLHNLKTSEHIIAVRFDGSLYFANTPYFEDAILEQAARHPKAKYILIVGDGINEVDASGEEVIRHLVQRMHENGITLVFSGLKMQVVRVLERTGVYALIGAQHFFRTEDAAVEAIYQWVTDPTFDAKFCPLSVAPAEADASFVTSPAPVQGAER